VVIAVVNNKGGVGKTTTSVNLAAALATPRRRVLLVDLDSQASASLWCGVRLGRLRPSSAHCLLHQHPVQQAVRRTSIPNLDLITGSIELASADVALCDVPGRELTLKRTLQAVLANYAVVVLDCPPGLSLVSVNALVASDGYIIPVPPHYLAIEALTGLLGAIEKVRTRLYGRARLLGILLTFVLPGGASEGCERVRARYRERVFNTELPYSAALQSAPAARQPVMSLAPRSGAAAAFRRLAGEVLERMPAH